MGKLKGRLCAILLASSALAPLALSPAQAQGLGWQWWLGGDYLFLNRASFDNRMLVNRQPGGPLQSPALFSDDASFSGRSAFRFFAGFSWDNGASAIEGGYFATTTFRSSTGTVITGQDDLYPVFTVDPFDNFNDADQMSVTRRTGFQTVDVNYRRQIGDFMGAQTAVLIGFRYASLTDQMSIEALDTIPPAAGDFGFYNGSLRNRLFGPQLGVILNRPLPELVNGLGVKFDIKVGFLANLVRNDQEITETDATGRFANSKHRIGFATMVDSGIQLTYEVAPSVVIHGGYRFIWLNGVATAANNVANFGGVNTSGSMLFHGPQVGLTLRYGDFRSPAASTSSHAGPPASWSFWGGAEYVFFQRNTSDNRLMVVNDTGTPFSNALFSDDAQFTGRSGFRAFGGVSWDGGRTALEGSYLALQTFRSGTASATDTADVLEPVFFATENLGAFEDADQYSFNRKSTFSTFEINLRRRVGEFWGMHTAVLAGFRFARFADRLDVTSLDTVPPASTDFGFYSASVRNNLYGAQFGVVLQRPLPELITGLGIKFDAKLGLMANAARNDQSIFEGNSGQTQTDRANRTALASLIDAGLQVTYEPIPNVMLHAGYRMMHLGGVATAVNNAGNFGAVNTSGTALFHGPTVGVTVKFGN